MGGAGLGNLLNLGSSAMSLYSGLGSGASSLASTVASNPATTYSVLPQGASAFSTFPTGVNAGASPSLGSYVTPANAQRALGFASNLNSVVGGDKTPAKPIALPEAATRKPQQAPSKRDTDQLLATLPPELRSTFAQSFGLI